MHDFANTETGAGMQKNDTSSFKEAMLKKCPWYFDLLDVFKDQALASPQITNESSMNLLHSDESSTTECDGNDFNEDADDELYDIDCTDNDKKTGYRWKWGML